MYIYIFYQRKTSLTSVTLVCLVCHVKSYLVVQCFNTLSNVLQIVISKITFIKFI